MATRISANSTAKLAGDLLLIAVFQTNLPKHYCEDEIQEGTIMHIVLSSLEEV